MVEHRTSDISTQPAVRLAELTRKYGDRVAVDRANFNIEVGETFGIIGPNGAGKSTLLRMLSTLLPPTSGTATVGGWDLVQQPANVRRHVGYVPQLSSAETALTGYENMLLSARLHALPRKEREERIDQALLLMGVSEAAHRLVSHYSAGMIRRLEIAQNLLHRPEILILDEPTAGLDPSARGSLWEGLLELRARFHSTIIVTSHLINEIDRFCDRVSLIDRAKIVALGTPAELKAKVGSDATLDDVFARLAESSTREQEGGHGGFKRARKAGRHHD